MCPCARQFCYLPLNASVRKNTSWLVFSETLVPWIVCEGYAGLEVCIPKDRGPVNRVLLVPPELCPLFLVKGLCPLGAVSTVMGQQAFDGAVGSA